MADFRLGDLIQQIEAGKEAMNVQLTGSNVELLGNFENVELTSPDTLFGDTIQNGGFIFNVNSTPMNVKKYPELWVQIENKYDYSLLISMGYYYSTSQGSYLRGARFVSSETLPAGSQKSWFSVDTPELSIPAIGFAVQVTLPDIDVAVGSVTVRVFGGVK